MMSLTRWQLCPRCNGLGTIKICVNPEDTCYWKEYIDKECPVCLGNMVLDMFKDTLPKDEEIQ